MEVTLFPIAKIEKLPLTVDSPSPWMKIYSFNLNVHVTNSYNILRMNTCTYNHSICEN